jgi:glycosyltransferase involved in cell wall biosynthesis/LmbE family N-acetylglucosaminyl deacetylase
MNNKEADIIPYYAGGIPTASSVIIFAPHPDDEVFGCGGSMALHALAGHPVRVILLTAGDSTPTGGSDLAYADRRLEESQCAAAILGIAQPECWKLLDRTVGYGEVLVTRMMDAIEAVSADVVYAPSLWETHPDHRATAMAAIEAVRRLGGAKILMLFELSAPLRPNRIVDISSVWERKTKAMDCFASQNASLDYPEFITALNRYRTMTLDRGVTKAEAFELYAASSLSLPGVMPFESEHRRLLSRGIPGDARDLPLVSIIVRTTLRATLTQAIDSAIAQTYQNIELILVDVRGHGMNADDFVGVHVPVQIASTGAHLSRAAAANLGLNSARGEYCLFLDDDDWLLPDHLSKLVNWAKLHPDVKAVHTAVSCVDGLGNPTGIVFDFPYTTRELQFGNFMPIHGVLFSKLLVALGCRFDDSFDLYEDWDFWLQVEVHTPFSFVPGVSAAYRIDLASGAGVQVDPRRAKNATSALYAKWGVYQTEPIFQELITRALTGRHLASQVAHLERESANLAAEFKKASCLADAQREFAASAHSEANSARQDAHHFREAHDQACADRDFARGACEYARQDAERFRGETQRAQAQAKLAQVEAQRWSEDVARSNDRVLEATAAVERAEEELHSVREQLSAVQLDKQSLLATLESERYEIIVLREQISKLDVSLGVAQSEVEQLQSQVMGLKAIGELQLQDLLANRRAVVELTDSTSWRLTRPVRMIGKFVREVRTVSSAVLASRAWKMGPVHNVRRAVGIFRREGIAGLRHRIARLLYQHRTGGVEAGVGRQALASDGDYSNWLAKYDSFDSDQMKTLNEIHARLRQRPLISIVMPVYNTVADHLVRAVESVRSQLYADWELCICDDASTEPHIRGILERFSIQDRRIRVSFQSINGHISKASNVAIAMAKGKYVAFLDHDDEMSPHALLRVVQAIDENPNAQVFYSDEDKIHESGQRFDPYFKPEFNLGLLRSHNYMCHFAVYEGSCLRQLGGLRETFEGAQDYDLALRAVDAIGADHIRRIPHILYHWRSAKGSTAAGHSEKSYAFSAGQRALTEHLARRGLSGVVEEAPEASGMYRIQWARPLTLPMVSIIIPTRNGEAILRQCLDSLKKTTYPRFEVIVVDNGSDDPATLELLATRVAQGQIQVLRDEQPFNFSALNNHAVRAAAQGEFVLLLNNDIEVMNPGWLDEMVGAAVEPGVGCVGARLWYPDGRLQHAGVILVCGVAGHAHKYLPRGHHGYMGRAVLAQDMVAVTAACLLVRKQIYLEVGGLDEGLAVAFNDIDFCLRVHKAGYRNHWTPYAELVHHESVTRGYEDTPEKQTRFRAEIEKMQARWPALLAHDDPCYSPNLTAVAEDFSLAWPPRRDLP